MQLICEIYRLINFYVFFKKNIFTRDISLPYTFRQLLKINFVFKVMSGTCTVHLYPLSYFSFYPVRNDWCNKGRSVYYPVCGMMHIKHPLLLIGKNSPCSGDSGFPLRYLSGPLPCVWRHITVLNMC